MQKQHFVIFLFFFLINYLELNMWNKMWRRKLKPLNHYELKYFNKTTRNTAFKRAVFAPFSFPSLVLAVSVLDRALPVLSAGSAVVAQIQQSSPVLNSPLFSLLLHASLSVSLLPYLPHIFPVHIDYSFSSMLCLCTI